MMRVDLFATIHKALRSVLFETVMEAGRVDLASDQAVDALAELVERMFGFLHEHAQHEDAEVLPLVRRVEPRIAEELSAEHLELEATQNEICRTMRTLAMTVAADRGPSGKELLRLLNVLTAKHLMHMDREETLGNAVLWGGYGDPELHAIRARIEARIKPERNKEWGAIIAPVLDPKERALMAVHEPVEVQSSDRGVVSSLT